MTTQERLYTADDLWTLSQERPDAHLELMEGMIIELPLASAIAGMIAATIVSRTVAFVREHKLGYVTTAEGGYSLAPNTVLAPDAGFIAKAKVEKLPERYFQGAPDLAVEVVSPTDSHREAQRKAIKYLTYGTRIVWIVYPEDRTVDVYRPSSDEGKVLFQQIGADGVLEGDDVLPGFTLSLKDIFEDLGDAQADSSK